MNISEFAEEQFLLEAARSIERGSVNDATRTYETTAFARDGRRVPLEIRARLIFSEDDNKPIGVQGIARDITERLASEEALRVSEDQLRQSQKLESIGILAGGLAHDFNNMLAVVVGGIDLARRRLNGPRREVMNHLNNAMEGATRAAALTRRLLSFARSEPLLPERVDPAALVSGMSDLLDRTLGERIHVEVDVANDAWPIYVDSHQLENAIVNLAVNARDAMEGQGLMRVTARNVTLAANEVGDRQGPPAARRPELDLGPEGEEECREVAVRVCEREVAADGHA